MNPVTLLRRLLAHDEWANHEALAAMRRAGDPPRARRLLAHILAAEFLWLARLKQDRRTIVVWPDLTIAECEAHIPNLRQAWREYLDELEGVESDGNHGPFGDSIAYVNSKGERWENTVSDILLHLALHSSYHRGQIALALRDSGAEPAYTDYIECVRRGLLPLD